MAKKFRDAFLDHLERSGWTLAYVAEEAGVSGDQLKKLKQGRSLSTNVDDAVRVAHVFGLSLDEFLGDRTIEDRREIVRLWLELSEAERDILRAAARGRADRLHVEG